VNNDPSINEQITYYDRWNEKNRAGQLLNISEEVRVRGLRVLEHIYALEPQQPKILEVGCGTGWLTDLLSDIGTVTAIDLSPRAIEIAKTRGIKAELIAGDFFQQEFPAQYYDIGICIETLFYVSDQAEFLKRFSSLLKPGALVGITTINKFVYDRRSDIGPPEEGQVRHWLSKAEIRKMFSPYFDIVSMETLEPSGDTGILRFVNSFKVNNILGRIFSDQFIKKAKEKLGFGGGIVYMCRRKKDS
jgi:2-polyprenyl-3-methyl-5-hydroxy-6-metoxy-1,4-benzoquinol methylase